MMDAGTLPIAIGFIILSALTCWFVISAKGHWALKLALVLSVPAFGLVVWRAVGSYRGYPTPDPLPEKALLIGASVREPDPRKGEKGAIHVWVISLTEKSGGLRSPLDYDHTPGEPRGHKLPYSREMHEMINEARKRQAKGEPVILERKKKGEADAEGDGQDPGEEGMEGNPGRRGRRDGSGAPNGFQYEDRDSVIRFYRLPPAGMPRKDPLPGHPEE